ncbi:hypothetical protein HK101_006140 [Irineochytrium annulatum]|nr:hypothetical protein HK101_006140 [Irineochytrium annulatum]
MEVSGDVVGVERHTVRVSLMNVERVIEDGLAVEEEEVRCEMRGREVEVKDVRRDGEGWRVEIAAEEAEMKKMKDTTGGVLFVGLKEGAVRGKGAEGRGCVRPL